MKPLIRLLPGFLVKFFARPYVAGDSLESGLDVAADLLRQRGVHTTLDLLYEGVDDDEALREVRDVYREMIREVATRFEGAGRPTVSLKPSSYTKRPLDRFPGEPEGSFEAIREFAQLARERDVDLTIDMEDRHWTTWTLDAACRLRDEGHDHVGVVLQTRLDRTAADVDALPEGMRVRLVIGIYNEPQEIATIDKSVMKERMLEYAAKLLERGHYVEFATHDMRIIRRFLEEVVPATKVDAGTYEVQMLYGVPMQAFQNELTSGAIGQHGPVRVRLYVPFATSWEYAIAYCRRRLLENPSMATAVARNVGRVLTGRR
ncbi:MAG: proline dehydrogenase family protein [Planctomycetes bacterium]|nr:proline dehydrogenase family protein [Planctomycetota bacterium]